LGGGRVIKAKDIPRLNKGNRKEVEDNEYAQEEVKEEGGEHPGNKSEKARRSGWPLVVETRRHEVKYHRREMFRTK